MSAKGPSPHEQLVAAVAQQTRRKHAAPEHHLLVVEEFQHLVAVAVLERSAAGLRVIGAFARRDDPGTVLWGDWINLNSRNEPRGRDFFYVARVVDGLFAVLVVPFIGLIRAPGASPDVVAIVVSQEPLVSFRLEADGTERLISVVPVDWSRWDEHSELLLRSHSQFPLPSLPALPDAVYAPVGRSKFPHATNNPQYVVMRFGDRILWSERRVDRQPTLRAPVTRAEALLRDGERVEPPEAFDVLGSEGASCWLRVV